MLLAGLVWSGLSLSPADIDIGHISYFLPVYGGRATPQDIH